MESLTLLDAPVNSTDLDFDAEDAAWTAYLEANGDDLAGESEALDRQTLGLLF